MKTQKPFPRNLQQLFKDVNDVAYFEASVNYTMIHLKSGQKHFISYTLKRFEEMLHNNDSFTRIHRKFIVNRSHIKHIGIDKVLLNNGGQLPVSRRRRVRSSITN